MYSTSRRIRNHILRCKHARLASKSIRRAYISQDFVLMSDIALKEFQVQAPNLFMPAVSVSVVTDVNIPSNGKPRMLIIARCFRERVDVALDPVEYKDAYERLWRYIISTYNKEEGGVPCPCGYTTEK